MVYRFTRFTEGVTSLNMYKGLTHWFTGLLGLQSVTSFNMYKGLTHWFTGLLGSLGLLWVSVTMN